MSEAHLLNGESNKSALSAWSALARQQSRLVSTTWHGGGMLHCTCLQKQASHASFLACPGMPAGQLISATSSLSVWDMNTTQLLFNLSAPPGLSRLGSSSGSSSSLSTAGGAAPAAAGASGAAAAAAAGNADAAHVLMDAADADAADGVLLQDGWLLDEEEEEAATVAAAAGHGAGRGDGDKPLTCVSCHGNLVAAGGCNEPSDMRLTLAYMGQGICHLCAGLPHNSHWMCAVLSCNRWQLMRCECARSAAYAANLSAAAQQHTACAGMANSDLPGSCV